ncbi:histone-lysine N-methyltransferase mes-4-like [Paramuricea clavata]|uniref:Histone-lysine N-methyltransferase mes-4-like n=1 Tax=Paramuricea clavata TaxID=317549 RepID=A0A7D9IIR4_PARCT|nr:histone-lysine N-methyltransferase mes-4-like [Paramuricea clavata]
MARRQLVKETTEVENAKRLHDKKEDPEGFEIRQLPVKGRAVFTTKPFVKGQFLLEYSGELITGEVAKVREESDENQLICRYFFKFEGKTLYYDASEETKNGPKLGRLVNHGYKGEINAKMKMVIAKNRQPILCLFAIKDIDPGKEILYDYGQKHYPWEKKVTNAFHELFWSEEITELVSKQFPRLFACLLIRVGTCIDLKPPALGKDKKDKGKSGDLQPLK